MANDLKKSVSVNLRCVTQSCKNGVLLSQLQNDYKELIGENIPFKELGYVTLESFLRDIADFVSIKSNSNGQLIVEAVADKSTAHIAKLISKQKESKSSNVRAKKPSVVTRKWGAFPKQTSLQTQKTVQQHGNITKSFKKVTPQVVNKESSLVTGNSVVYKQPMVNIASRPVVPEEISSNTNVIPKKKKKWRKKGKGIKSIEPNSKTALWNNVLLYIKRIVDIKKCNGGAPLRFLEEWFPKVYGKPFPHQELRCHSLADFIKAVPNDLAIKRSNNAEIIVDTISPTAANNINQPTVDAFQSNSEKQTNIKVQGESPQLNGSKTASQKAVSKPRLNPNSYFYRSEHDIRETPNSHLDQSSYRSKTPEMKMEKCVKENMQRVIGKALGLKTPISTSTSTAARSFETPSPMPSPVDFVSDVYIPPPIPSPAHAPFVNAGDRLPLDDNSSYTSTSSSLKDGVQDSSFDRRVQSTPTSVTKLGVTQVSKKVKNKKVKLKSNPEIRKRIERADITSIFHCYFILFGCFNPDVVKKQILNFSGFAFSENSTKWIHKRKFLLGMHPSTLRNCLHLLGIDCNDADSNQEMVDKMRSLLS